MARTSNYEYGWSYFGSTQSTGTRDESGSGDKTIAFGYTDFYGRTTRTSKINYSAGVLLGNKTIVQPAHEDYWMGYLDSNIFGSENNPISVPLIGLTGWAYLETNKDFTSNGLTLSYSLTYNTTIKLNQANVYSYSGSPLEDLNSPSFIQDSSIALNTCSDDYGKDQKFNINSEVTIICPAYLKGGLHQKISFKQGNTLIDTGNIYITSSTKTLNGGSQTINADATSGSFDITSNYIGISLSYEKIPADNNNNNLPTWSVSLSTTSLNSTSDNFTNQIQSINVTTNRYYGNQNRNIKITANTPGNESIDLGNLITQSSYTLFTQLNSITFGSKTSSTYLSEGGEYESNGYFDIWFGLLSNRDASSSYFKLVGSKGTFEYDFSSENNRFEISTTSLAYLYGKETNIDTSDTSYYSFRTTVSDKNYGANTYYKIWIPCRLKATTSTYTRADFKVYDGTNKIFETYCYFKTSSSFSMETPSIGTVGGNKNITITSNDSWSINIEEI